MANFETIPAQLTNTALGNNPPAGWTTTTGNSYVSDTNPLQNTWVLEGVGARTQRTGFTLSTSLTATGFFEVDFTSPATTGSIKVCCGTIAGSRVELELEMPSGALKLYVNGVVKRGFILGAPNQARLRLSLYRKGVNIVGTIYRLDRFEVLARANLYSALALAGDVWIEQTGAAFRIERVAGNDASYSAPTLAAPTPLTLVTANPRSVTLRCGGHPEAEKYIWEQLVAAVWTPVSETVVPVTTIQNLQSSTAYDFRVSVATREREAEPIYDTAIPWSPDENWDSELVKPDTLSMVLWNRNRRWNDGAVWG